MALINIKLDKFNSLQINQFLRFGSVFLISILLAKISYFRYSGGYGTSIISRYELLMLVSSSLSFFWVASICNTLIPFYNASDEGTQRRILFNAFALLTLFSLVAGAVTIIIGHAKGKDIDLFEIFGIVVFLNTPTFITDYIFYLKGKYKSMLLWGMSTYAAHLVLLCVPLFFRQSLNLSVNLLLILALVKFNYTIILLMKYSTISIHTRLIKQFMIKVMPFMFSILLAGSVEYINSYIIDYYYDETQFAIFRYGAKELPIFLILANSLSNIYSGEIANLNREGLLNQGLAKLKVASRRLMYWVFPGTIVLLFVSKYLFEYAYNVDLKEGYKIFNIYLLLIISRMLFPQAVITGLMKTRVFYLVSTNYLIINVVLSFVFVRSIGIDGIAYATVISFLVEKIMLAIYCKMEGIRMREYTPIPEYLLFSALTLIAFFLPNYIALPF